MTVLDAVVAHSRGHLEGIHAAQARRSVIACAFEQLAGDRDRRIICKEDTSST